MAKLDTEEDNALQLLELLDGMDGRLVLLHDVHFADAVGEMQDFLGKYAGAVSSTVAQDTLVFKALRGLNRRIGKFKQQQKEVIGLCGERRCLEEAPDFRGMLEKIARESPKDVRTILSLIDEDS